ncbi:hypothetical protein LINPERPRIM_LOCUS231, partial [Linum perenne]
MDRYDRFLRRAGEPTVVDPTPEDADLLWGDSMHRAYRVWHNRAGGESSVGPLTTELLSVARSATLGHDSRCWATATASWPHPLGDTWLSTPHTRCRMLIGRQSHHIQLFSVDIMGQVTRTFMHAHQSPHIAGVRVTHIHLHLMPLYFMSHRTSLKV